MQWGFLIRSTEVGVSFFFSRVQLEGNSIGTPQISKGTPLRNWFELQFAMILFGQVCYLLHFSSEGTLLFFFSLRPIEQKQQIALPLQKSRVVAGTFLPSIPSNICILNFYSAKPKILSFRNLDR